jgi:hypothetical protein
MGNSKNKLLDAEYMNATSGHYFYRLGAEKPRGINSAELMAGT